MRELTHFPQFSFAMTNLLVANDLGIIVFWFVLMSRAKVILKPLSKSYLVENYEVHINNTITMFY